MTLFATTIISLVNCIKCVSFKLNNADFPPLYFPSASKPVPSPFITAYKSFSHNINIR